MCIRDSTKAVLLTEDEQNKKSTCGTVSYMPAVFGCYLEMCIRDRYIIILLVLVAACSKDDEGILDDGTHSQGEGQTSSSVLPGKELRLSLIHI